jgi:hypothetical protein
MNILILHRIPYHKIEYHRGIDHDMHTVTYIGTEAALSNIPQELRCRKMTRRGEASATDEVSAWLTGSGLVFDRILSLSEYELYDAARLRERFGVVGPSVADVRRVRDKVVMKRSAASAGIRVPRFLGLADVLANDEPELLRADPWIKETCVLKPIDGASSEDVRIFASGLQAKITVENLSSGIARLDGGVIPPDKYELEEFIVGEIIHIDGLMQHGRCVISLASRYVGTCAAYAGGSPLGSVQIPQHDRDWTERVLLAVGIFDGSFHLEAFEQEDGLVFLEVAHRVGGADVVATFELATGVHLPSMELAILLGDDVRILESKAREETYGWFVFPGHHLDAEHVELDGFEQFSQSRLMFRSQQLPSHMPLPKQSTYQAHEVPAAGIVHGSSTEEVADFMRRMFAQVRYKSPAFARA